ncbi:MAG TPA: hypothetical protein VK668_22550 [Mucilaginibacter sp.]|nr:hypothetical protein [Mucilaginibacter sp.]
MKYFYRLIFIFSLLPLFSFGQIGYYPGYAVTLKNDTLRGYIDYKNWENNPRVISFKSEAQGQSRKLTVQDIKHFSIDIGSLLEFERYEGPISMDKTNIQQLPSARDSVYQQDTVFLKVMQKGKNVVLYSYDDNLKTRFFIAGKPEFKPAELTYRIYYNTNSTGSADGRTVYENTYKKQLLILSEQYNVLDEPLQILIGKSSYKDFELVAICSKINGISEKDITKTNHEKKQTVKLVLAVLLFLLIAYGVFDKTVH